MVQSLNDGKPFRMPDSWYDPPSEPDLVDCPDCKGEGVILVGLDEFEDCEGCGGSGDVEPTPYEPDPDDERDQMLDRQYEEGP
jgi:hypothetical protein